MIDRLTKLALLTAYQSTLMVGIALLPVALLARKVGVTLPFHRLIQRTEDAYRSTRYQ